MVASLLSLPQELLDMILAHFTRHLIKSDCPKCFATRCTCSDDGRGGETELCRLIAQNVSALAGLNRACNRLYHLTTSSICQCPQTKSPQATWYLTRTLLARQDLAAMVEFLVLGRWTTPATFEKIRIRQLRSSVESDEFLLNPAPIWQDSGVLPDEVLSYFRKRVGLDCDIVCLARPLLFGAYDSFNPPDIPVARVTWFAALRLHNSAPADLITSLCPNLEALETDSNVSLAYPGGVFWNGFTFDPAREVPGCRGWPLERFLDGSARTLPNLKSLKIWRTKDTDRAIEMDIEPVLYHALCISPAIENLEVRGMLSQSSNTRLSCLWTLRSPLKRLRLEEVFGIIDGRPDMELVRRLPDLEHLVLIFHECLLPHSRTDIECLRQLCPRGMKRIEIDVTQSTQNPQARPAWYSPGLVFSRAGILQDIVRAHRHKQ